MQGNGDFAVDTDIVMAYSDDSVRHFLQAMELNTTLDTFEREWCIHCCSSHLLAQLCQPADC